MLWGKKDPYVLAESWFASRNSDLNFLSFMDEMRSIRQFILHLSRLKSMNSELGRDAISSEEGKVLSESLLAQLKQWELKWAKEKKTSKEEKTTLQDYFVPFAIDSRRAILSFLQCFNISIPNVLNQEDSHESFWTSFSQSGGQGIRSGKVFFLEQPNQGQPGSRQARVFIENRLT